ERADAKTRTLSWPRSRSKRSVTAPTAPVPPTTPMRGALTKLEWLVQSSDCAVDLVGTHVTGDLDRRGRHHSGLDALPLERGEGLGRDARVALHAGADHRHLGEVLARAPVGVERVEGAAGVCLVLDRRREDDLGPRLHDRGDVDGGIRGGAATEVGRGVCGDATTAR